MTFFGPLGSPLSLCPIPPALQLRNLTPGFTLSNHWHRVCYKLYTFHIPSEYLNDLLILSALR